MTSLRNPSSPNTRMRSGRRVLPRSWSERLPKRHAPSSVLTGPCCRPLLRLRSTRVRRRLGGSSLARTRTSRRGRCLYCTRVNAVASLMWKGTFPTSVRAHHSGDVPHVERAQLVAQDASEQEKVCYTRLLAANSRMSSPFVHLGILAASLGASTFVVSTYDPYPWLQ